jgi:NADH dehydrogenase FAD-containing subunit
MSTNTVIILGAGWAGLPLAHKLLKHTLPKLPSLKVVLVTPNSHFFWNVAATRGLIPGEIPDDQLFLPIAPAFDQYPAGSFELVLGAAEAVEEKQSTVTVRKSDGSLESLPYGQLVVATGSRVRGNLPLKPVGTHDETLTAWHELQAKVGDAKSIVVSGGGATGVEVAGELAARYGAAKDITLIMADDLPVKGAMPSVRATVDSDLQKLGVKMVRRGRATAVKHDGNKQVITTSDGTALRADVYLPLHGITLNTHFLPPHMLEAEGDGSIKLDPSLRVAGTANIWAIGDVGNVESKQLTVTDGQIIHLASALDAVLTKSQAPSPYSPAGKTMIFLSLGRRHATGQVGNWKLFGFMVSWVKGRRLFVDTAQGYVGGKHLRHAAM